MQLPVDTEEATDDATEEATLERLDELGATLDGVEEVLPVQAPRSNQ